MQVDSSGDDGEARRARAPYQGRVSMTFRPLDGPQEENPEVVRYKRGEERSEIIRTSRNSFRFFLVFVRVITCVEIIYDPPGPLSES